MPRSRRRAAVTGPTPHSASTGSFCRNCSTRSGAITVRPSGFFQADAIFARNLFGATPADAVSPVAFRISVFSRCATAVPSASPHAFSVTSRYASSSDSGSTSGVTERKISNTVCDAAWYLRKSGRTMTSAGRDGPRAPSGSRTARRTRAPRSWRRRRRRAARGCRRPRPACRAAPGCRAARRTRRTRPCRCGGSGALRFFGLEAPHTSPNH